MLTKNTFIACILTISLVCQEAQASLKDRFALFAKKITPKELATATACVGTGYVVYSTIRAFSNLQNKIAHLQKQIDETDKQNSALSNAIDIAYKQNTQEVSALAAQLNQHKKALEESQKNLLDSCSAMNNNAHEAFGQKMSQELQAIKTELNNQLTQTNAELKKKTLEEFEARLKLIEQRLTVEKPVSTQDFTKEINELKQAIEKLKPQTN
jgi:hypothetical protein